MARQGIMLANKITERKIDQLGEVFFMQPKLNGLRGWVDWNQYALLPSLVSSGGNNLVFFEHIQEELIELRNILGKEISYDGEVYEHGMSMEDIHSIARRTVNRKDGKLSYHIFDTKTPTIQSARIVETLDVREAIENSGIKYLKVVHTDFATKDTWKILLHQYLEEGYEGAIFRDIRGEYVEKKCNQLLKHKARANYPYTIVSVLQGEG